MSGDARPVRIGIIGGSGLYDMDALADREEVVLSTPFGEPSAPYIVGTLKGQRVAFLARHGVGHRLLPSELNFRANIFGLKMLGVEWILSASAVGSLQERYRPLDIVVPVSPGSHAGPDQHVLRARARRAHPVRPPAVRHPERDRVRRGCGGWSHGPIAAARTCVSRARSFRRWPSRVSTGRGSWM